MPRRPFRILSLSGGGVRGIYQAVFLRKMAADLAKPFKSNFEIISGTSTGSIIAAALACDVDLAEIESFYRIEAPKIFTGRFMSSLTPGPHYRQEPLRNTLQRIFGNRYLRDVKNPLVVIPATTLTVFKPRAFWNFDQPGYKNNDLDLKLVDVILASCAAPTYFEPVRPSGENRTYVDGGLWANSPCLISAIYAHVYLQVAFKDMRILSVGNGMSARGALAKHFAKRIPLDPRNVKSILAMLFETQAMAAENNARYLVGKDNLKIVDDHTPGIVHLDDVETSLAILPSLAETQANGRKVELKDFLTEPEAAEEAAQPVAQVSTSAGVPAKAPGSTPQAPEPRAPDGISLPPYKQPIPERAEAESFTIDGKKVQVAYRNGKFVLIDESGLEVTLVPLDPEKYKLPERQEAFILDPFNKSGSAGSLPGDPFGGVPSIGPAGGKGGGGSGGSGGPGGGSGGLGGGLPF